MDFSLANQSWSFSLLLSNLDFVRQLSGKGVSLAPHPSGA
jgi:hypothetical protein